MSSHGLSSLPAAWGRWVLPCLRAIGAKVACRAKKCGQSRATGGFQDDQSELATIVQEKLDINIAIINNGYLGMIRQWQETFLRKNYECSPIFSRGLRQAGGSLRHPGCGRGPSAPEVMKRWKRHAGHKGPFLINFMWNRKIRFTR